jgi:hypothetical protein
MKASANICVMQLSLSSVVRHDWSGVVSMVIDNQNNISLV